MMLHWYSRSTPTPCVLTEIFVRLAATPNKNSPPANSQKEETSPRHTSTAVQKLDVPQPGSQVQQGFMMGGTAAAISVFRCFPYHLEPFPDFVLHVLAHGKFGKQVPVNMTGIR